MALGVGHEVDRVRGPDGAGENRCGDEHANAAPPCGPSSIPGLFGRIDDQLTAPPPTLTRVGATGVRVGRGYIVMPPNCPPVTLRIWPWT